MRLLFCISSRHTSRAPSFRQYSLDKEIVLDNKRFALYQRVLDGAEADAVLVVHANDIGGTATCQKIKGCVVSELGNLNIVKTVLATTQSESCGIQRQSPDGPVFFWKTIEYLADNLNKRGSVTKQIIEQLLYRACNNLSMRSSLSMLCLGYLSAHSGSEEYLSERTGSASDNIWKMFLSSGDWKRVCEHGEIQVARKNRMETEGTRWWREALGEQNEESVLSILDEEFGSDESECVRKLVRTIYGRKKLVDCELVAFVFSVVYRAPKGVENIAVEWQKRRSTFNHRWLRNFLVALGALLNLLDDEVKDIDYVRSFITEILFEWEREWKEALLLANDFELGMSPQRLFDYMPLSQCDAYTKQWLGGLAHHLWHIHCGIDELVCEAIGRAEEANAAYIRLNTALKNCVDKNSAESLRLYREQFATFRDCCQNLAHIIEKFPSNIQVI